MKSNNHGHLFVFDYLPVEIIHLIFQEYLDILDLLRFDSAITWKVYRKDWKRVFHSIISQNYRCIERHKSNLYWLPTISTIVNDEILSLDRLRKGVSVWKERTHWLTYLLPKVLEREIIICISHIADNNIALGTESGKIFLWTIQSSDVGILQADVSIKSIAPLPRERLISISQLNYTIIWDIQSRSQIYNIQRFSWTTIELFDGRLAMAKADGDIEIWNAETKTLEITLEGHYDSVFHLIQLRDGRVASGSGDGNIRLWNLHRPVNEMCELVICTRDDFVSTLGEIPDNGRIISSNLDGEIQIWNPCTGRCERVIRDPDDKARKDEIAVLTFLSNGQMYTQSNRCMKLWEPV